MAALSTTEIKEKAEELVSKISGDSALLDKFKADPKDTVKSLIKDKVSDDVVEKVTDVVKAKLKIDDVKGVLGSVKGLFKK